MTRHTPAPITAPTPSPATVAEIRVRLAARADRIAQWNRDIDDVVATAIDAHDDGYGIAIAVDFARSRCIAERREDIPDGYAVIVTVGDKPGTTRIVPLSTAHLPRKVTA